MRVEKKEDRGRRSGKAGEGEERGRRSDVGLWPGGAYPPACMTFGQEAAPEGGRERQEKTNVSLASA